MKGDSSEAPEGSAGELERTRWLAGDNLVQLQAVLDSAVDGIITIDEKGTIEGFSRAATRIFGYAPEEVVGENVKLLMPEPHRSEHDGHIARYRNTGQARIIGVGREVEGRRRNGETFPADLAISEVRLAGRRVFMGFIRDISERKEVERL